MREDESSSADGAGALPSPGRGLSLRAALLLLVVGALVPVIVFAGWMVARTVGALEESVRERGRGVAAVMAVAVDRELTGMIAMLRVLAGSPALAAGDLAGFHAQAAAVSRSAIRGQTAIHIVLTDPEGQQLVSTRRPFGEPLPRAAAGAQVAEAARGDGAAVSNVFTGAVAGAPLIAVSTPVRRDGAVFGVLHLSVPIQTFEGVLVDDALPAAWSIALRDRTGRLIATSGEDDAGGPRTSWYEASARSAVSGWSVVVGVPDAAIRGPMGDTIALALGGGALLLAVGAAAALLVGRWIAGPVTALAAAAQALGRGETPRAVASAVCEVTAVGAALRDAGRRRSEADARQTMMMAAAQIGGWRLDPATGLMEGRGAAAELLGVDPEVAQAPLSHWFANVPEEQRGGMIALLGGVDGDPEALRRDIEVHPAAGQPRWLELRGAVLSDAEPGSARVVGVLMDVTERHRAHEEQIGAMSETLRQAQKMESIGQLTGGIAHDFNNLLQAIGSSLYLIESASRDERMLKPLRLAVKAVDRGANLTQHLLAFSRRQRLEPRAVDVNALVRRISALLERTLDGTVRIVIDADPDVWPAMVDPNQLETAIVNLAINARDAMSEGGTLTIATERIRARGGTAPVDLAPGDYVRVAVIDNGAGMTAEVAERAFEPFFTTKGSGRGSGLGLSMVHGLAAQSGGAVVLDSQPGQGTTVSVYLPRAGSAARPETTPPRTVEGPLGDITVLLVEDEALVRMATSTFLADAGFQVVEAANGNEALDLLERQVSVDVVLTDHAMPGMTGLELARTVRRRFPQLPVLMVTGYAEMPRGAMDEEGVSVVQKPYRPDELLQRLGNLARRGVG